MAEILDVHDDGFLSFMRQLLEPDRQRRPCAKDLLSHPFVAETATKIVKRDE